MALMNNFDADDNDHDEKQYTVGLPSGLIKITADLQFRSVSHQSTVAFPL